MISLISLLGCAPDPTDLDASASALRYEEGSPEALGLQAFLNDAGTTFTLLTTIPRHLHRSDDIGHHQLQKVIRCW